MKKTIVLVLIMFCVICSANAQMIISRTGSTARVDVNGDGLWDTEVNVGRVPYSDFITPGQTLANALGKCYCANIWRQYEAQGINPANAGIPNPWRSEANFSQYASAYAHLISYSGMMGGVIGGMGLPGTASVGVQVKGVGVGISIPVNTNNGLGGLITPNATVGVNVKGNGGMVSLPIGIKTGSKKSTRRQATTTAPATQQTTRVITVPATQQTRVATPTTNKNRDSVEMTVDEIQDMLSDSYM